MIVATLSYEEMLRRHPVEVAEIVTSLRKGKSKHRDADPATLTWTYQAGVLIDGGGSFRRRWEAMSLEEKVADQVRRTSTGICASIGRWCGGSDQISNPPEVEENARASFQERADEDARIAAMAPEEREQEIADLLRQLSGSPGFMAFGVK